MPLRIRKSLAVGAVALLIAVGALTAFRSSGSYHVTVPLDSAANLVEGGPVMMNGFQVGHVDSIKAVGGKAMVGVALDPSAGPLHDGAQVDMSWKAVLSERQLQIVDGPATNPAIPNGGMVPGKQPSPVELDQVLDALDKPTRARLTGLIAQLRQTLGGHEGDARNTIKAAGPALLEVGSLLDAVGTDGPAIHDLVTRMSAMFTEVNSRNRGVQRVVTSIARLTNRIARQRVALSSSLRLLPGTLRQGTKALDKVPAAAGQAVPLLQDLSPATASLKTTAVNLRPLLIQLRPTVADLNPVLVQAGSLLGYTPAAFRSLNAFLPKGQAALGSASPGVSFLRPYVPELAGWVSTWDSAMADYDGLGHFTRLELQAGPTSVVGTGDTAAPGSTNEPYPAPGGIVGQPWTDADGSTLR